MGIVDYPRVLVVNGEPFTMRTGQGIVMSSLFRGWPKDRLAEAYFVQTIDPDFDVCEKHLRITRKSMIIGLFGKSSNALVQFPETNTLSDSGKKSFHGKDARTPWERLLRKMVGTRYNPLLNDLFYRLPSLYSSSLKKWISEFHPDILFSMLGNGILIRTNVLLSRRLSIPCVPYLTDDWITYLYKKDKGSFWLRPQLQKWFQNYLDRSPIRTTVSTDMVKEYTDRYKGFFIAVLYPFDPPAIDDFESQVSSNGIIKFIYLGALRPDRWRSLRLLGEQLLELRRQDIIGELLIYTFPDDIAEYGAYLNIEPVMRVVGTALPVEVPIIQRSADILVHVECFDESAITVTSLSFSTKIPQYLYSGRCILAFGPSSVASIKYFKETGSARVVSEQDPDTLRIALKDLILDSRLRMSYSQQALEIGKKNHDGPVQREKLRLALVEACRLWKTRQNNC